MKVFFEIFVIASVEQHSCNVLRKTFLGFFIKVSDTIVYARSQPSVAARIKWSYRRQSRGTIPTPCILKESGMFPAKNVMSDAKVNDAGVSLCMLLEYNNFKYFQWIF